MISWLIGKSPPPTRHSPVGLKPDCMPSQQLLPCRISPLKYTFIFILSLHKECRLTEYLFSRHPANQEPFSGVVNPKENTVAYGSRAIPKLVTLLGTDLNEKERIDALRNGMCISALNEISDLIK